MLEEGPAQDGHARHDADLGLNGLVWNAEARAYGTSDRVETVRVRVNAMIDVHQGRAAVLRQDPLSRSDFLAQEVASIVNHLVLLDLIPELLKGVEVGRSLLAAQLDAEELRTGRVNPVVGVLELAPGLV